MLRRLFPFLYMIFSFSLNSSAQDVEKDFQTESISIFKNGTAFFIKSGEVTTTDGHYSMQENIPAALFGTLWIHSPGENLKEVISFTDTITEKKKLEAFGITGLLRANSKELIDIYVGDKVYSGTIEEWDREVYPLKYSDPLKVSVLVKTIDNQWISIKTEDIDRVGFRQKPSLSIEKTIRTPKDLVQVNFNKKWPKEKLDMMYLAGNISWSPNYLIELTSEKTANLTLRAEMTNNAEAINNTDINFVVGVPNFKYANKLSSLISFMKQMPGVSRQANNFLNLQSQTQSIGYGVDEAFQGNTGVGDNQVGGSEEEDLYFYSLNNITLPKGGRGHYNLSNNKIAIKHIYECSLTSSNSKVNRNNATSILSNPNDINQVTHAIKVINDSKSPWTTGSAMVVTNENKPISQDQMNYTPVGGHSFVKLTTSPDVQVKHREKVIKTEERAKFIKRTDRTYIYDKITIEGKIDVKNYKSKAIDLNIRRAITGHLEESSIAWLESERVQYHHQINLVTDVCWETGVKAGGTLEVTYTYFIYAGH